MALDERLRRELEEGARPADPSGVYEELTRRRERRKLVRKVEAGALAVVVVLGSIGGVYALMQVFGGSEAKEIAATTDASGEIVFSVPLESGGEHLFAVRPDGRGLRQLTTGAEIHRSPDVSPDGRTVAFAYSATDEGPVVLATVAIDGGPVTWRTDARYGPLVLDPAWSPDGERIAFAGSIGGRFGIVVYDVATGDARLIPETDNMLIGNPTWSPDGEKIAFEGAIPDPDDRNSFPWDIYSVRLDGSQLTNLTGTPDQGERSPAWSWTSDRIAFMRGRGPASLDLYTMAANGAGHVLVYEGLRGLDHPAWSPDGALLAFSADTGQVYTVPSAGGEPTAVAGAMGEPAWRAVTIGSATPSIQPTPTPSPQPTDAGDLGLGFPVCNVSSIDGRFVSPNARATAFAATRVGDTGGCPQADEGFNVLALDVDGDGLAESSFGPIKCELECRTFSAPDIDGDGTDELLVVQGGGAVVRAHLYDVASTETGPSIVPLIVAAPGDPEGGFDPGDQATFLVGGDAFELYGVQCGDVHDPNGPGVIATRAESLPHDSPDAAWHAHQTTLVWQEDGVVDVVDVRDFTEPVTDDPAGPSFRSEETLCGSNLGP